MTTALLFDVPATGKITSKRKPKTVNVIKVNHELAKRRYYFHRRLKKFHPDWPLDPAKRIIDLPFKSYKDMPKGDGKYYVGQLLKLGYTVQLKIV